MTSPLLLLAKKVEGLRWPDRLVDAEVALLLGLAGSNMLADRYTLGWCVGGVEQPYHSSRYTASVDAALSLVPEGFSIQVSANSGSAYATVVDPLMKDETDLERVHSGNGKTPALALVAASLRARAAPRTVP